MKTKLNVYVNMNQSSIADRSSMELRVIFQVLFHGDANRRLRYTTKYYFLMVENEEVGKSKTVTLDLNKKSPRPIKWSKRECRSKNLLKVLVSNQHRSTQITRKWRAIWSKVDLCNWIRFWINRLSWGNSTDLCSWDDQVNLPGRFVLFSTDLCSWDDQVNLPGT